MSAIWKLFSKGKTNQGSILDSLAPHIDHVFKSLVEVVADLKFVQNVNSAEKI